MNLAAKAIHSPERKPVVLTTVPYYLPGFKGGGKLITVRNLIAALRDQFHFKVVTADHDLGETQPYAGIASNRWTANEGCEVFYASSNRGSLQSIREELQRTDYDILHLNTVFSRKFGIIPLILRRFGRIARRPMIIAPRGELAPGALAIKSARKQSFLSTARALGLFAGARWQASSDEEARDLRGLFGSGARIAKAPDLLSAEYRHFRPSQYLKRRGKLDIVFLSRVTPKKNLHLALEALRRLEGAITFRIVGPIDDSNYWMRCGKLALTLGSNIRVEHVGPIGASEVSDCLGRHGLFLLPTANENFGFVILEALLAGCPVLISDQTPWRDLSAKGIGWDLPLAQPDLMLATLQHCVAMDATSHRAMSIRARTFALDYIAHDDAPARNAALLNSVLAASLT